MLAEWIAQLLQHGLLRGSFIPPAPIRDLREATRYRKQLIRLRADETNRLQKLLEGANLKLGSVASDILGASGRAMLAALVHGETEAAALASLAKGRLRKKQPQLVAARTGRITRCTAPSSDTNSPTWRTWTAPAPRGRPPSLPPCRCRAC